MKKDYGLDELSAISEAKKALFFYNSILKFPVEKQYLDDEVLDEYFLSDDEQKSKDFEKKVGSAVIKYCFDNQNISKKKETAVLMYSQIQDALRGAKIEADFCLGKLGNGFKAKEKREALRRENDVVQKAVFIENARSKLQKMPRQAAGTAVCHLIAHTIVSSFVSHGVLVGTAAVLGTTVMLDVSVGVLAYFAYEAVIRLIPKYVRERIESIAEEAKKTAENVIEANIKRLKPDGRENKKFRSLKL